MNEIQKANSFFLIGKIFFYVKRPILYPYKPIPFSPPQQVQKVLQLKDPLVAIRASAFFLPVKTNNSLKNNRNCLTTYYKKQFTEMDNGAFWELLLPNEIIAVSVPFFYLGKGLFNPINAKFKQNGNPLFAHLFELLNTYTTK